MDKAAFKVFENFMLSRMGDSAHDKEHIYRVLYVALDIAAHEKNVNRDNLIIACLLHDIGREEQFKDPSKCHAKTGAEAAYKFCVNHGVSERDAEHIRACISSHRYRGDNPPESIEAKILFDADKIDVTGAIGIARTLFYAGNVNVPLYYTDANGNVLDGTTDERGSFVHEYNFKLKNLYDKFYTERGRRIAGERRQAAVAFYDSLMGELADTYKYI